MLTGSNELRQEFKRNYVISRLRALGISHYEGDHLNTLDYRTLIYLLALKRAVDS